MYGKSAPTFDFTLLPERDVPYKIVFMFICLPLSQEKVHTHYTYTCISYSYALFRHEAYSYILHRTRAELLKQLDSLPPESLLGLLEISFPFVGLEELRAVPLAILDKLQPVPATFLKQLVGDPDLFRELPLSVQRQAWDLDRKLLQAHALSAVVGYTHETATILPALDMLPASAVGKKRPQALPRRILRRGSAALQRLTRMTGHSRQIYRGLLELIIVRFRDSDQLYVGAVEAALCALRSQLLMALHDVGEAELCSRDGCHKLAWTLDACLSDGRLDARRMQELAGFFARFERCDSPGRRRQRQRTRTKRWGRL